MKLYKVTQRDRAIQPDDKYILEHCVEGQKIASGRGSLPYQIVVRLYKIDPPDNNIRYKAVAYSGFKGEVYNRESNIYEASTIEEGLQGFHEKRRGTFARSLNYTKEIEKDDLAIAEGVPSESLNNLDPETQIVSELIKKSTDTIVRTNLFLTADERNRLSRENAKKMLAEPAIGKGLKEAILKTDVINDIDKAEYILNMPSYELSRATKLLKHINSTDAIDYILDATYTPETKNSPRSKHNLAEYIVKHKYPSFSALKKVLARGIFDDISFDASLKAHPRDKMLWDLNTLEQRENLRGKHPTAFIGKRGYAYLIKHPEDTYALKEVIKSLSRGNLQHIIGGGNEQIKMEHVAYLISLAINNPETQKIVLDSLPKFMFDGVRMSPEDRKIVEEHFNSGVNEDNEILEDIFANTKIASASKPEIPNDAPYVFEKLMERMENNGAKIDQYRLRIYKTLREDHKGGSYPLYLYVLYNNFNALRSQHIIDPWIESVKAYSPDLPAVVKAMEEDIQGSMNLGFREVNMFELDVPLSKGVRVEDEEDKEEISSYYYFFETKSTEFLTQKQMKKITEMMLGEYNDFKNTIVESEEISPELLEDILLNGYVSISVKAHAIRNPKVTPETLDKVIRQGYGESNVPSYVAFAIQHENAHPDTLAWVLSHNVDTGLMADALGNSNTPPYAIINWGIANPQQMSILFMSEMGNAEIKRDPSNIYAVKNVINFVIEKIGPLYDKRKKLINNELAEMLDTAFNNDAHMSELLTSYPKEFFDHIPMTPENRKRVEGHYNPEDSETEEILEDIFAKRNWLKKAQLNGTEIPMSLSPKNKNYIKEYAMERNSNSKDVFREVAVYRIYEHADDYYSIFTYLSINNEPFQEYLKNTSNLLIDMLEILRDETRTKINMSYKEVKDLDMVQKIGGQYVENESVKTYEEFMADVSKVDILAPFQMKEVLDSRLAKDPEKNAVLEYGSLSPEILKDFILDEEYRQNIPLNQSFPRIKFKAMDNPNCPPEIFDKIIEDGYEIAIVSHNELNGQPALQVLEAARSEKTSPDVLDGVLQRNHNDDVASMVLRNPNTPPESKIRYALNNRRFCPIDIAWNASVDMLMEDTSNINNPLVLETIKSYATKFVLETEDRKRKTDEMAEVVDLLLESGYEQMVLEHIPIEVFSHIPMRPQHRQTIENIFKNEEDNEMVEDIFSKNKSWFKEAQRVSPVTVTPVTPITPVIPVTTTEQLIDRPSTEVSILKNFIDKYKDNQDQEIQRLRNKAIKHPNITPDILDGIVKEELYKNIDAVVAAISNFNTNSKTTEWITQEALAHNNVDEKIIKAITGRGLYDFEILEWHVKNNVELPQDAILYLSGAIESMMSRFEPELYQGELDSISKHTLETVEKLLQALALVDVKGLPKGTLEHLQNLLNALVDNEYIKGQTLNVLPKGFFDEIQMSPEQRQNVEEHYTPEEDPMLEDIFAKRNWFKKANKDIQYDDDDEQLQYYDYDDGEREISTVDAERILHEREEYLENYIFSPDTGVVTRQRLLLSDKVSPKTLYDFIFSGFAKQEAPSAILTALKNPNCPPEAFGRIFNKMYKENLNHYDRALIDVAVKSEHLRPEMLAHALYTNYSATISESAFANPNAPTDAKIRYAFSYTELTHSDMLDIARKHLEQYPNDEKVLEEILSPIIGLSKGDPLLSPGINPDNSNITIETDPEEDIRKEREDLEVIINSAFNNEEMAQRYMYSLPDHFFKQIGMTPEHRAMLEDKETPEEDSMLEDIFAKRNWFKKAEIKRPTPPSTPNQEQSILAYVDELMGTKYDTNITLNKDEGFRAIKEILQKQDVAPEILRNFFKIIMNKHIRQIVKGSYFESFIWKIVEHPNTPIDVLNEMVEIAFNKPVQILIDQAWRAARNHNMPPETLTRILEQKQKDDFSYPDILRFGKVFTAAYRNRNTPIDVKTEYGIGLLREHISRENIRNIPNTAINTLYNQAILYPNNITVMKEIADIIKILPKHLLSNYSDLDREGELTEIMDMAFETPETREYFLNTIDINLFNNLKMTPENRELISEHYDPKDPETEEILGDIFAKRNWLKKAQLNLGHQLNIRHELRPFDFSDDAFPFTLEMIDKLELKDVLTQFAEKEGFKTPMDYLLCSLYPKYKQECLNYYEDKGEKLVNIVKPNTLKKYDQTLSNALWAFYEAYKNEMNEAGNTNKMIKMSADWAEDLGIEQKKQVQKLTDEELSQKTPEELERMLYTPITTPEFGNLQQRVFKSPKLTPEIIAKYIRSDYSKKMAPSRRTTLLSHPNCPADVINEIIFNEYIYDVAGSPTANESSNMSAAINSPKVSPEALSYILQQKKAGRVAFLAYQHPKAPIKDKLAWLIETGSSTDEIITMAYEYLQTFKFDKEVATIILDTLKEIDNSVITKEQIKKYREKIEYIVEAAFETRNLSFAYIVNLSKSFFDNIGMLPHHRKIVEEYYDKKQSEEAENPMLEDIFSDTETNWYKKAQI